MTKNGNVTLEKVYTLVDQKIGIVNDSIVRLENKFDILEQGRISPLESKLSSLEGRVLASSGIIAFIISIALTIASVFIKK